MYPSRTQNRQANAIKTNASQSQVVSQVRCPCLPSCRCPALLFPSLWLPTVLRLLSISSKPSVRPSSSWSGRSVRHLQQPHFLHARSIYALTVMDRPWIAPARSEERNHARTYCTRRAGRVSSPGLPLPAELSWGATSFFPSFFNLPCSS